MKVPGVSIMEMFMRVRGEVMKRTGNKQVPWEASSLVGSFYFAGGDSAVAPPVNGTRIDPTAFELSYWETIKNSQNRDDFKAYLDKYPEGQFAQLAKNRINSLISSNVEDARSGKGETDATELAFWDSIKSSNNPEDYRAYVKRYPTGAFLELANNRINSLSAGARDKAAEAKLTEARPTQFSVHNGKTTSAPNGTLFISASGIDFVANDHPGVKKLSYTCAEVKEVQVSSGFPRDTHVFRIRVSNDSHNFRASSSNESTAIVETIRSVCKLNEQNKKP
jgi:hypothetical protein